MKEDGEEEGVEMHHFFRLLLRPDPLGSSQLDFENSEGKEGTV